MADNIPIPDIISDTSWKRDIEIILYGVNRSQVSSLTLLNPETKISLTSWFPRDFFNTVSQISNCYQESPTVKHKKALRPTWE